MSSLSRLQSLGRNVKYPACTLIQQTYHAPADKGDSSFDTWLAQSPLPTEACLLNAALSKLA